MALWTAISLSEIGCQFLKVKYINLAVTVCVSAIAVAVFVMSASATFGNTGNFQNECSSYYGSTDYYSIAKFEYNGAAFILDEVNNAYKHYEIEVEGSAKSAEWKSSPDVFSVLVKSATKTTAFSGGYEGQVSSVKDISHVTFCGKKMNGGNNPPNGVPEFSTVALGAAVLMVGLGLVFLRKK